MSKFNSLLIGRFKSQPKKEKMGELVERNPFAGAFQVSPMSEQEKKELKTLLEKYQTKENDLTSDFKFLSDITSEVKSISNQAVILHGERIKKAQEVLKDYKDGAFSSWLLQTYGNRQTPYNFMQYYELYNALPTKLKGIVNEMPRQAIYSLSSRSVPQEKKEAFVEEYKGESKAELLEKLRTTFPIPQKDKRYHTKAKNAIDTLKRAIKLMEDDSFDPKVGEKAEIEKLLRKLQALLHT